jgi:hypothetical protein
LEASSDFTARDQAPNIVCAFIGVEAFHVHEMFYNLILKKNSVASHAFSGKSNNLTGVLRDHGFASGGLAHGDLIQVHPLASRDKKGEVHFTKAKHARKPLLDELELSNWSSKLFSF